MKALGVGARLLVTALLLNSAVSLLASAQGPAQTFLDAYLRGSGAIDIDAQALISDLDRRAESWIQADPAKAVERRRVVAIALLDVFSGTPLLGKDGRQLVEWACAFQRRSPSDEFDRLWMLTAALVLKDTDHTTHAQPRHPRELRITLAGLLHKPEATTVANLPNVDVGRLSAGVLQGYVGGVYPLPNRINDTIKALEALAADPAVGSEATLRLGLVEYLTGRSANGIDRFPAAAETTTDPYLTNLARMMEGLAHEAAGHPADALRSYRAALQARPTISAALAISTSMFLEGDRSGAAAVLGRGDLGVSRPINPWHDPIGDRRFVADLIDQLRTSVGLPAGRVFAHWTGPASTSVVARIPPPGAAASSAAEPTPPAPVATTSPAQVRPPIQFRSSTNSVMVDVAVFDGKTPVTGLTADDFEILDNGVPQTIGARSMDEVPLDVTVIVEFNDPVGRSNPDWPKRQGLADTKRIAASLTPNDRFRMLVASSAGPAELVPMQPANRPVQWQPFTDADLVAAPTSSIFDTSAIALMTPVPADRRALVLLFTDGIDGASVLTPAKVLGIARVADPAVYSARRYTFGELSNQRNVAAGRPPTEIMETRRMLRPISPTVIDDIVRAADGRTMHPSEVEPMADTFIKVLNGFRQRYVFFYTPTGVSESGWHRISVRLKKPRGYSVTARRGWGS